MSAALYKDLSAPDGILLKLHMWNPQQPNRVLVFLLHGHGEHMGRYQEFAERLLAMHCHVYGLDLRGHGQSGGKRGHAFGIEQFVQDFETLLPKIIELSGCDRVILFGHSMGGATLARYLCSRIVHPKIVGAIFSSTIIAARLSPIQKLQMLFAKGLAKLLPSLTIPANHDINGLSTETAVIDALKKDRLYHNTVSLALGTDFAKNGQYCMEQAGTIKLPVLAYCGTDDIFVETQLFKDFINNIVTQKTFHEFEGCRHEPHNADPTTKAQVFQLIEGFVRQVALGK